ncbi:MAG: adenylate/guanylate cyclase domain-containing protein [Planctomycetota bacterium]
MTLSIYLILLGIKIVLARSHRLPKKLIGAYVVLDMFMLSTMIWGFHFQYEVSLAAILKAPTFSYYFVYIALRALNTEIRWVALGTVSAICGWGSLVAMSMFSGDPVTHGFAEYIRGEHLLLGAEVDRLLALLAFGGILAVAIRKNHQLLQKSIVDAETSSRLTHFFPKAVLARLVDVDGLPSPGQGEVIQAVTLMTDIRGFSQFAEHATIEHTMAVLSEYQEMVHGIITRHRGIIDKYMGDGVLVHFGIEASQADPATACLQAMEAIRLEFGRWVERCHLNLDLGMASAIGKVTFGIVGNSQRMEYTAIGSSVNMVAKLEKHCKALQARAVTTRDTFDEATRHGWMPRHPYQELPRQMIPGMDAPTDLVVLDSMADEGEVLQWHSTAKVKG